MKIKIEISDDKEGIKDTRTLEAEVKSYKELSRLLYNLSDEYFLRVMPPKIETSDNLTKQEKLLKVIKSTHSNGWIRSQDIKKEYETIYGEEIKPSTLSTYLARFHEKGILDRRGNRRQIEYMLLENKITNR